MTPALSAAELGVDPFEIELVAEGKTGEHGDYRPPMGFAGSQEFKRHGQSIRTAG